MKEPSWARLQDRAIDADGEDDNTDYGDDGDDVDGDDADYEDIKLNFLLSVKWSPDVTAGADWQTELAVFCSSFFLHFFVFFFHILLRFWKPYFMKRPWELFVTVG